MTILDSKFFIVVLFVFLSFRLPSRPPVSFFICCGWVYLVDVVFLEHVWWRCPGGLGLGVMPNYTWLCLWLWPVAGLPLKYISGSFINGLELLKLITFARHIILVLHTDLTRKMNGRGNDAAAE